MKKLPKIELKTVNSVALGISVLGFCLMMTDTLMNVGAILFSLGLLPLAVTLARNKDE
jgi:Zn-dependent membrane protease YugP